jgi:uracil-DNA glycosylase family 4
VKGPGIQPEFPQLSSCVRCPRLAGALAEVRERHTGYHARAVPAFGDASPSLLIVGLAPGMHGANRTGRPFTGDYAGELLYNTLHVFGWSSAPVSASVGDGLALRGCRITNAVKCWPPANKPEPSEIRTCNDYLRDEIDALGTRAAILALGLVAHGAVLRACGLSASAHRFAHGARHALPEARTLFDSYHCSRYNTQTRRLTPSMFEAVFAAIDSCLARS